MILEKEPNGILDRGKRGILDQFTYQILNMLNYIKYYNTIFHMLKIQSII